MLSEQRLTDAERDALNTIQIVIDHCSPGRPMLRRDFMHMMQHVQRTKIILEKKCEGKEISRLHLPCGCVRVA